jgi:hypothetical protein
MQLFLTHGRFPLHAQRSATLAWRIAGKPCRLLIMATGSSFKAHLAFCTSSSRRQN